MRIRGTKTDGSARVVPILGVGRPLMEHALRYAEGTGGLLFRPWGNIRRDLHDACERAGIPPVSANDLRRTTATWMVLGGVPLHLVAKVLGHVDTRMVERVYGQLPPAALQAQIASILEPGSSAEHCTTFAPNGGETRGNDGLPGRPISDPQMQETPKARVLVW